MIGRIFLPLLFASMLLVACGGRQKRPSIAVQCYSFRHFSFLETLEKISALGVKYVQAYENQRLSDSPDVKFDYNSSEDQIEVVKEKLKEHGLTLVAYGVVNFDNNEESMRKVFDFAKTMGVSTIVTEPKFDDYSLLEGMVKEYDIQVAIHNHAEPSKYAHPQTVLEHVKGLDERIGACPDTGHWMRSSVDPIEGLRLLKGRVLDVHLKDLNEFGVKEAHDVPYGQGKADVKGILAELMQQDYDGFITIEYEGEPENPSPSIKECIEYLQSL